MIEPGLAAVDALAAMREAVRPGITLLELDAIAEEAIRARGAEPNFMLEPGYRHTICANLNEHVVHAIPTDRALEPGDVVALDVGAILGGWNSDAAITAVLPDPERPDRTEAIEKLSHVTEQAMWHGIARLARAKHLNEVGEAVSGYVRKHSDYGVLEDYIGHGIGRSMHEDPPVFNVPVARKGPEVKPGSSSRSSRSSRPAASRPSSKTTTGRSRWPTAHSARSGSTPSQCTPTASGCSPPKTAGPRASNRSV